MIYEYQCKACECEFEIEQKMKSKPRKKCPNCKKMQLRRLISLSNGFQLKGGGWYADGYSGKSNKRKS